MQIVIAIAVMVTLLGAVHYYLYRRFIVDTGCGKRLRLFGKLAIFGLGASAFSTFPLSRSLPVEAARVVTFIPYVWMGLMVLILMSLIAVDLVRLIRFVAYKIAHAPPPSPEQKLRTARGIVTLVLLVNFFAGVVSVVNGLGDPAVKCVEVGLSRLPAQHSGLRIVQLTDLHIGPTLGRQWLEEVVGQVNALEPDIVVITGDLVDGSVENLKDEVAPLADINSRLGTYFVTGNHENFSGVDEWMKKVGELGIRVLDDEAVPIKGTNDTLYMAGVSDPRGHPGQPGDDTFIEKLASIKVETGAEAILLLHNPRPMLDTHDERFGLVLTGHTHGGQIWPFTLFVRIAHPYLVGLYKHDDRTRVYVNEGTGFWGPPMRLGTRGEIALITLVSTQ